MTPPPPGPPRPSQSGRMNAPTDLRSRAHAKLAERIDLNRSRHKPISLLRAEAKRVLDSFYDVECVTLTRAERDRLVEDTIAAAVGFSPLEELFRDEAVKEILVLGTGQTLTRKGEAWVPANARFRDTAQVRATLSWLGELGDPMVPGAFPVGGLDVRLPNGFRLIAVVPPDVLQQPPLALFVRSTQAPLPAPAPGTLPGLSGVVNLPWGGPSSGVTSVGTPPRPAPPPVPRPSPGDSVVLGRGAGPSGPPSSARVTGPQSGASADPLARVRQRVTERLIAQLAAAGVYDLTKIPGNEMRKIIAAYVAEQVAVDRLGLDDVAQERLAIEILAGMSR